MNFALFLNFELVNLPKMHIFCIFPHGQGAAMAYLSIQIHLSRKMENFEILVRNLTKFTLTLTESD